MGKGGSKIAAAGEAAMEFDQTQLESLPTDIREQIEKVFGDQQTIIDELKDKYERSKVDCEQKNFTLEKQLIASNERLEEQTKTSTELRLQVNDLESKYQTSSEVARNLQEELLEKSRHWAEVQLVKAQVEAEKNELSVLVEKKDKEIGTLREEWKVMSEKVNEANKVRLDALARLETVQTQETTVKYREARLQQERDQVQQHNQWLEAQLKEKSEELLSVRKDKSSRLLGLQSQLDEKTYECCHLEETVESLRETVDTQNTKIETYIQKLRDSRDAQTHIEEQYRNEVQAQEKLVQLYKDSATEAQVKGQELLTAVEELRGLLKQATDAHRELKKQREEDVEERDETISRLDRELADANTLLDELRKKGVVPLADDSVAELAPTAAATSRLLKSGMTLTQIYTEYVQVSENLHLEKQENQRLNVYLDQLLQEIEEKAPMMRKQREDYEKSVQTVQQLTKQLDTAMLECEKLRQAADSGRRRVGELDRENARFRQQTCDLSQQVRMLLKELEESRGTLVSMSPPRDPNVSSSEVSSSSQTITQKLVNFRSIEELQEQNQKLLEVVRELSENKEEEERLCTEDRTAEMKKQLDDALEEIEMMQSDREKRVEMVESVIRQRDMYKVLAQSAGSPVGGGGTPTHASTPMAGQRSPQTPGLLTKSPGLDRKAIEETTEAMKELQEQFNIYRKEKAENEKMLSSQLDKMRTESSDMKVQNARLASQLDFSGDRYKVLQSNVEGYKKEITALREKNQKMTSSLVTHEDSIASLREDLMATQESLSRAEVRCQHLSAEKDMLRNSEARLLQEKESVMREKQMQNLLLANLQAIQNNLERSEFDTKTRLSQRIEDLEKENNVLKRRKDSQDDQHKVVIDAFEAREKQRVQELASTQTELAKAEQQLQEAENQVARLNQELSQTEAQFVAVETRLSNVTHVQTQRAGQEMEAELNRKDEQIKDFKSQLQLQNSEIKALKEQLVKVTQHAEQYKQLANSVEQNLREQNMTNREFKEGLEKRLEDTTEALAEAEKEYNEVKEQKQKLINENLAMTEQHQKTSQELQQRLSAVEKELQESVDLRESAITVGASARTDLHTQSQLAEEWQDKYQRELMLHAADVKALSEVKEQLDGFNQKLIEAEEEAREASETLATSRSSWAEQEKLYQAEESRLETRASELQEQNALVHQQLHTLSEQMVQLQQNQEQDEAATSSLADTVAKGDINKSNDQLLQVIRFLRKEKDIAEAKYEVVQAEAARIKEQLTYQQKLAEDANKVLAEERQKAQASLQTAAQHAELLGKVENLNLLRDSNRMMRSEKERLVQQLREMEAKAKQLEEEIHPLQASVRDLTAQTQVLGAEKLALRKEADSWRRRTDQLIESYNKADPEEVKRVMHEREQTMKQIGSLNEDVAKQRADLSRVNNQLRVAQSQVTAGRQQAKKLTEEMETLNTSNDTKDKELAKINKTVLQVKAIGRKYKMQAEEALKETAQLKETSQQQQGGAKAELLAAETHLKEVTASRDQLQEKLKTTEESLQACEAKIKDIEKTSDGGIKAASDRAKAAEDKCMIIENKVRATEDKVRLAEDRAKATEEKLRLAEEKVTKAAGEVAELTQQLNSAQNERSQALKQLKEEQNKFTALSEENNQLQQANKDAAKQQEERKSVMLRLGPALSKKKEQVEKLTKEMEELKQKLANAGPGPQSTSKEEPGEREAALKQRVSELVKQVEELKSAAPSGEAMEDSNTELLQKLQEENAELMAKVQQLQKQLEKQQKPSQPSVAKPKVAAPPSASSMEQPKTANILPRQQAAPVRHHQETRAMASVRPLAVSPMAPSTLAVTATTPTATVMPTTVNIPEGETTPPPVVSISPASATQSRPTQQVQPVPPHIEQATDEAATESSPTLSPVAEVEPVAEYVAEPVADPVTEPVTEPVAEPVTEPLAEYVDEPVAELVAQPMAEPVAESMAESVAEPAAEPLPSTSGTTTSDTPTGTKRSRDDSELEEVVDDEEGRASVKRTKVQVDVAAEEQSPESAAVMEPETQDVQEQSEVEQEQEPDLAITGQETLEMLQDDLMEPVEEGDQEPGGETPDTVAQGSSQQQVQGTGMELQQEVAPPAEPSVTVIPDAGDDDDDDDDDVICVDVDEDDQDGYMEGFEEDEEGEMEEEPEDVEEEEDEDIDSYQDEMEEEEDEEEVEDEGEGEEETARGMSSQRTDDAVVVVLDDDDDDDDDDEDEDEGTGMGANIDDTPDSSQNITTSQQSSRSQPSSQESQPAAGSSRPVPPQLSRMPSQVDRQMSVGRAQQLTPFASIMGEGGYELGDDSIVPCTPTLIVPKRTDGFAEAVSSPSVHERFIFGSGGGELSPFEVGLESQEALGMDDTQVDLSQFDDTPGGRAVPICTSATRTTPTISVTEASPPAVEAEEQGEGEETGGETLDMLAQSVSTDLQGEESVDAATMETPDQTQATELTSTEEAQQPTSVEDDVTKAEQAIAADETAGDEGTEAEPGPSTSNEGQSDNTAAPEKPKIKRIVWTEAGSSSASTSPQPMQQLPPVQQQYTPAYQQQMQQQQQQQMMMQGSPQLQQQRGRFPRSRYSVTRGRPQLGQPIQRLGQQQHAPHQAMLQQTEWPPRGRGRGSRGRGSLRGTPHRGAGPNMRGAQFRGHRQQPF